VGPGDPELVTLKALAALRSADAILVPSTEASAGDAGRAEQIVTAVHPDAAGTLIRVPFSMEQRRGIGEKRQQAWEASALAAVRAYADGARRVAFATIGDPSVYSTFSYLAAHVVAVVPGVTVSVIPGITAMQAIAAATLTPLVEGRETLTLVPATAGLDAVGDALDRSDTVVAYKGGRGLGPLLDLIASRGRTGYLGVNIGLPGQRLTPLADVDVDRAPYFSTVLVPAVRETTGGRL
jgi:precorrin-2/cobalt-factor-2 C20-methyltransferase